MKTYRITILADKYPTNYTVEASGVGTATARAIRLWKKKFKGSRADEWTIKVIASPAAKDTSYLGLPADERTVEKETVC